MEDTWSRIVLLMVSRIPEVAPHMRSSSACSVSCFVLPFRHKIRVSGKLKRGGVMDPVTVE